MPGQSDVGLRGAGTPQSPTKAPHPNPGVTWICWNSQLCGTWIKAPQRAELGVQSQHCSGCCALCPDISLPSGLGLQTVWQPRTPFYVFIPPFALSLLHYICLVTQDFKVYRSFWVADFFFFCSSLLTALSSKQTPALSRNLRRKVLWPMEVKILFISIIYDLLSIHFSHEICCHLLAAPCTSAAHQDTSQPYSAPVILETQSCEFHKGWVK